MTHQTQVPNAEDARQALASVQEMSARGFKRGLYSRWYAIAVALWGGALAVTLETWLWPIVFAGGLIAHIIYRKKADAWVKEIHSKRDLWVVLAISGIIGMMYVGAYISVRYYDLGWVPVVAGIVIALSSC